jgi:hypothetical protein
MTKNFLLLLTLTILGCASKDRLPIDCIPTNLQNGVIAFYPFKNGSLLDIAQSNHLTNPTNATPAADRNGNANCAFQFKSVAGKEEFLTETQPAFLNGLNAFSISIWYQPLDTFRSGGIYEVLVSRGKGQHCPNRNGEWSVGLYDCRRAVFGHDNSVWANPISPNMFDCQAEVNALTDKWHHVVAVKNGDTYKIYFNGKLEETVNGDGDCSNPYTASDIGDFFIGRNYTGKIDDVLVFNRELSQAEVTELYQLVPCCL